MDGSNRNHYDSVSKARSGKNNNGRYKGTQSLMNK
jgi:hypothetical protein